MNKVVFTFGRLNPPTKGHEKLMQAVVRTAHEEYASNIVFLSHTQNNKTDPLDWDFKYRICNKAFPFVNISKDEKIRTPFQALESLAGFHQKAIMVVGSDQVEEFERMRPYAEKWKIEIDIRSAGLRNKSGKINGISASRMRQYVRDGKDDKFFEWCPTLLDDSDKKSLFLQVSKSLKGK